MENIMKSIVMLIDMYYHRKRLMKRWRSIKHYQRTGIIGYKPGGLPISKNPPPPIHSKSKYLKSVMDDLVVPQYISAAESAVKNKLVNSKEDYYQMLIRRQAEPKESEIYKLNSDILSYLNSVGAKANVICNKYDMRDLVAIDVTYKNYKQRFEYSDYYYYNHSAMQYTILDHIKVFIKQTDLKIEEHRKLLHKKNNPHGLKIGNEYLVRYNPYTQTHFDEITIDRFTDLCFPWSNKLGGILSPDMYDIKTIDGKWIHNCKQWDEFQAKKKLNNEYQLNESDLKYLRDRGVQFSFELSNVEGQHSVLKIVYKYKTQTDIFYGKPLKADIFNAIMDCAKSIDRKENESLDYEGYHSFLNH